MRIILVPALITLAVTLARLAGELLGGSGALFSREAGGKAALVGIVWLIPVFGIYFGRRLARDGERPPSVGKALRFGLLAFAVNVALLVALPQLSVWIWMTIAGGMIFAALALAVRDPPRLAPK